MLKKIAMRDIDVGDLLTVRVKYFDGKKKVIKVISDYVTELDLSSIYTDEIYLHYVGRAGLLLAIMIR